MSRKRWIYIDGEAYDADGFVPQSGADAPMVMPDIAPYKSMATGEVITSRSQHREHLKRTGFREVDPSEVSTEKIMSHRHELPEVSTQKRRELIRAQFDAMPHDEFKRALKRDIDRVKWNSNH